MSAFYFSRTVDFTAFRPGQRIHLQNFYKDSTYTLDVKYKGRQEIEVDAGNGHDTIIGSPDIADSLNGGHGDDTIIGQGGNDTLIGNDGHDSIVAGTGDDSIRAGDGQDLVTGDAGNDTINAGDGSGAERFPPSPAGR